MVKGRGAYLEVAAADPKRAAGIQPGTYVLLKGMTAQTAFDTLADPANRAVNRTTVREGLWASETYSVLSKATGIPVKEYVKAAKDSKAIGLPKEADAGKVEGWLAPSSYEFSDKSTATQQLKADGRADREGARRRRGGRGQGPPEGADPGLDGGGRGEARRGPAQDRQGVPQPDRDRWRPGLRADPVRRGRVVGAKRRALFPSKAELDDASNPYNTRIHPGLPPGPISNPGAALDRRGRQPGRRPLVLLRRGQPDHRRDQVRRRRWPSTTRTSASSTPTATPNPQDCGSEGSRPRVAHRPLAVAGAAPGGVRRAPGLDDWEYDAHEVDATGLAAFVAGLGRRSGAGCR